jgi:cation-transporting P-type ATPase E
MLILTIGLSASAYPFLPRHLSLAASLTIGIPAFFLALAPTRGRYQLGGFLRALLGFAGPYGVACAAGVLACYALALHVLDMSVVESRTVATTALTAFGLFLVVRLEAGESGRISRLVELLVPAMAVLFLAALIVPFARRFFELAALTPAIVGLGLAGAVIGAALAVPLSGLARSRAS